MPPHKFQAVGLNFNALTIVADLPHDRHGQRVVLARCICGTEKPMNWPAIKLGHSKSCGCFKTARIRLIRRTHGLGHSPEYRAWRNMHRRCYDPHDIMFKRYGGRGIVVCDRWHSMASFYADMGPRPTPKHQLDRIDNDRAYSPDNCRWATRHMQDRNKSVNVFVSHAGENLCLADWSAKLGIPHNTLRYRLSRGWPIEKVLTR